MHFSQLPIPEPCCESWNDMSGDDARRFCDSCEKEVVNLSTLTRQEAAEFLRTNRNPCVRAIYDESGTVYFVPVQLRRQRQGMRKLLATAAAVVASSAVLVGCDEGGPGDVEVEALSLPAVVEGHSDGTSEPRALSTSGDLRGEPDWTGEKKELDIEYILRRLDEIDEEHRKMAELGVVGGIELDIEAATLRAELEGLEAED